MNTFAKNIIYAFLCDDNTDYLKERLMGYFTNQREVREYLNRDLKRRQYAFSKRISIELSVSDPMEGTTVSDQVLAYNTQFLRETTSDLERDVVPNLTPLYTVSDVKQCNGRSSALAERSKEVLTADQMLAKWNDNPGALHQYRDDNQGDFKASDKNYYGTKCYDPMYDKPTEYCAIASGTSRYCGNASTGWGLRKYDTYKNPRDVFALPKQPLTEPSTYIPRNPNASVFAKSVDFNANMNREGMSGRRDGMYGSKDGFSNMPQYQLSGGRQAGGMSDAEIGCEGGIGINNNVAIDFCDQSDVGTSSYYDMQFNTFYSQRLNKDPEPHTLQPFGYSTAASDKRLMERRIFRNNEAGEEGGISRYEVRLQRRNLDRDNGETFSDTQYDYQQRGHDMSDLMRRTNTKVRVNDKKEYDNSMTDKLRYSGLYTDVGRF